MYIIDIIISKKENPAHDGTQNWKVLITSSSEKYCKLRLNNLLLQGKNSNALKKLKV